MIFYGSSTVRTTEDFSQSFSRKFQSSYADIFKEGINSSLDPQRQSSFTRLSARRSVTFRLQDPGNNSIDEQGTEPEKTRLSIRNIFRFLRSIQIHPALSLRRRINRILNV